MIQLLPGVGVCIDSGVPGNTIGIMALTHGNEHAGLQAQEFFLDQYAHLIQQGQVYLLHGSPAAYRRGSRFIDVNLNRIGLSNDTDSYEYNRLHTLLPYLDKLDFILDIHSVPANAANNQMMICHSKDLEIVQSIGESERILIDDKFDEKGSLISYITRRGGVGIGIECGSHEDPQAASNALTNILHLVSYAGCFGERARQINTITKPLPVYSFYEEIYPQSEKFSYTEDYKNFSCIQPGEVYATDGDILYQNTTEDDLYLGIIMDRVIVGDGMGFLFTRQ